MIYTEFMPYCSECSRLNPVAESHIHYLDDGFTSRKDWTICCTHQKECAAMTRYLKKELSKENKNGN